MTTGIRFVRGEATPRDLGLALDELGVRPGDAFYLAPALQDPSEARSGGARASDPGTSKAAAFDALPRTGSQRMAALDAIRRAEPQGLTYAEVQDRTGVEGIWKRLSELKQGGWIVARGTRLVTDTGSQADVYVLTDKALLELGAEGQLAV